MTSLTSELIVAKTKINNLSQIKKLNCWASNLNNVSILSELPNLEILTLSVNSLESLRDIQHCHRLTELYIRNNKIDSLGEIFYLKNLKHLRILWLADNKCAQESNYRQTVLRNLPHLHKLDNTSVTREEIDESARDGILFDSPPPTTLNEIFNSLVFQDNIDEIISPLIDDSTVNELTETLSESNIETDRVLELLRTDEAVIDYEPQATEQTGEASSLNETSIDKTKPDILMKKNSKILQAVLLLVEELESLDDIETVIRACQTRKSQLI